jgi:hypothetical protein
MRHFIRNIELNIIDSNQFMSYEIRFCIEFANLLKFSCPYRRRE